VIIGPDVSKSKLEKQVTELEKITGSKGQLLKFKPLNP
jgi:DedD protein